MSLTVHPHERRKLEEFLSQTPPNLMQELIYFFNEYEVRERVLTRFIKNAHLEKKCEYLGTLDVTEFHHERHDLLIVDNKHHPSSLRFSILQRILPKSEHPQTFSTPESFLKSPFNITHLLETNKKFRKLFTQRPTVIKLFSVCLQYKVNSVHFCAFIYDPIKKIIVCFDPGASLYLGGERHIIPGIVKAFRQSSLIGMHEKNSVLTLGLCGKSYFKKFWGVQFNGQHPKEVILPADAFCQTWTLFFLCEFILNQLSFDFQYFRHWCHLKPRDRELFLFHDFIKNVFRFDHTTLGLFLSRVPKVDAVTLIHQLSSLTKDRIHLISQKQQQVQHRSLTDTASEE